MIVLGIESTCDETSASIVKNGKQILSLVTASSSDIHAQYGGVFPEMACRHHIEVILPVIEEAMKKAKIMKDDIDLIAVAMGPGLIGALLIGMQAAKGLSIAWQKPFIGVNHIEAHLYAAMMQEHGDFPALGLVLSGGHTLLLQIKDIGNYVPIGTTVDDALGEAFDKVAILLGLPYPGGPQVEKLALKGNPNSYSFKAGSVKRSPFDFSFSGIKTSVLYTIRDLKEISIEDKANIAASFQEAALGDIVKKTQIALKEFPDTKAIYLGGGVCNNDRIRDLFAEKFPDLPVFWPSKELSLDNAAMIAGLGYQKFLRNPISDPLDLEVKSRIPIA